MKTLFFTFFFLFLSLNCKKEEEKEKPCLFSLQEKDLLKKFSFDGNFFNSLKNLEDYVNKNPSAVDFSDSLFLLYKTKIDSINILSGEERNELLAKLINEKDVDEEKIISHINKEIANLKKFGQKTEKLQTLYEIAKILYGEERGGEVYKMIKNIEEGELAESLNLILLNYFNRHLKKAFSLSYVERIKYISFAFEFLPTPSYNINTSLIGGIDYLYSFLKIDFGKETPLKEYLNKFKEKTLKSFEGTLIALYPPYVSPSLLAGKDVSPSLILNEKMGEGNLKGNLYPLEEIVIGEKNVYFGIRPILSLKKSEYSFIDKEIGLSFLGKEVLSSKDIEDLKKIKKIENLVNIVEEFKPKIEELEKKVFPDKVGLGFLNNERENDKSIIVLIDSRAILNLIKSVFHTLSFLNYNRFLIIRGNDPSSVIPVLYQSTDGIGEKIIKDQPKRPLLFHFKKNGIDIYPPVGSLKKLEGEAPAWDKNIEILKDKKGVFKVSIPFKENIDLSNILKNALLKIEKDIGMSPFVHFVVDDETDAGLLSECMGKVSSSFSDEIKNVEEISPQLVCFEGKTPCITHIPVLFSKIAIPLPPKDIEKPREEIKVERPAGFCDKKEIAFVVKGRSGAYKACYDMVLQRNPSLEGKIELRWIIELDGSVSEIKIINNTLNNKTVEECVIKQVQSLRFAKPEGGVCVVNWPFKFSAKER